MSRLRLRHEHRMETVETSLEGETVVVRRDGGDEIRAEVLGRATDSLLLRVKDQIHRARLFRSGRELYLHLDGRTIHFHWLDEEEEEELDSSVTDPVVRAPMPGKVIELLVEPGARVAAGAAVIRVEAMKMEVDLTASIAGTVEMVHVAPGQLVAPDAVLVTLKPLEDSSRS